MRILAVICVLAAGVNAQLGESGVINPDGTSRQFTREEAENILVIGPSGYTTKDGKHVQFSSEFANQHNAAAPPPSPVHMMTGGFGPSGIVMPSGVNVQFTPDQAENIVLVGPSGVITKDGSNIQLTAEGVPRVKRDASESDILQQGPSGILFKDGGKRHLPSGVFLVLEGPSGFVFSDGSNYQKN